ncbi:hypothetical protein [Pseudomonas oryzihabitans]|uniref:hypothetical protein n=1 Tax=Pseudomonas oryzihabitans TaxID=47885 RepID=UPI001D9E995F|nr:hypothetical protein [Pseudomonas oryzihabitans]HJE69837.1 hypothetical protein [Pseudomonas oryzihabitans]
MINLTQEQFAEYLRRAYRLGANDAMLRNEHWVGSESFHDARERAIQPLVHRSSGGHDDHGREVKP